MEKCTKKDFNSSCFSEISMLRNWHKEGIIILVLALRQKEC